MIRKIILRIKGECELAEKAFNPGNVQSEYWRGRLYLAQELLRFIKRGDSHGKS